MLNWNDYGNGIYCIDTGYARPQLAAMYLIVENGRAAFVDTGSNDSIPNALEALAQLGLSVDAVDYVILTHIHLDHAGGAGLMMQKFPNAKLVVHPRGARHMAEPSKLIAGVTAVYGAEYVTKMYGEILPIAAERIIEAADKTTISLNGRELLCIDTPGHARHHICIIDQKIQGIFTGDMFGLSYRELDTDGRAFIFPTTTPTQFDPDEMRASIARLLSYQPTAMYLTHFGKITDLVKLSEDLLRHISALTQAALFVQTLNLDHNARHTRIKEAMQAYLLMQVRMFGCTLTDSQLIEIFATDIELNTQGMGVWLDGLSK
ncbi:MAG: Beta-lactamase-like protein [Burkholderiaceae bacterium]|nr:Beta-lactamase-like protein [Burkholderiaceae bacterium]